MPMISVEGPELKHVSAVFRILGILLQPQRSVGGFEDLGVPDQFEIGLGAIRSAGRRHRGESKPKRNPCFSWFVVKHRLIPGSRLVTEGVPEVRTTCCVNSNGRNDGKTRCPRTVALVGAGAPRGRQAVSGGAWRAGAHQGDGAW